MNAITAHPGHDRCLRPACRRKLTNPASRERGYGPVCWRRMRESAIADAIAGYTPEQVEKAVQLIADNGLIATGRAGVYQAASSDGSTSYLCTADICNCKGGSNYGRCYHMLAVRIMAAVAPFTGRRRVIALGLAA